MTRYSQVGTEAEASKKQKANRVPDDQVGKWFHGTNSNITKFHNKNNIWLSCSENGGKPNKKKVIEVYVVEELDHPHWEWPGAGDPEGKDSDGTAKDKQWLKVEGKEVNKLMVINEEQEDHQEEGQKTKKNYSIFDFVGTSEDPNA